MSIEKLVEECGRSIAELDCLDDGGGEDCLATCAVCDCRAVARAVIRRTLEYAAEQARIWGYQNGRQTEDDNNGWCNEQAGETIADHFRSLARSLPKAEGERGTTPPKSE